jgi:hypothetical protein
VTGRAAACAEPIGGSRWRVPVPFDPARLRVEPPLDGLLSVRALGVHGTREASVELVLPPSPARRDCWVLVVALESDPAAGGDVVFEVVAAGHPPVRVGRAAGPPAGVEPPPLVPGLRLAPLDPTIDYEARDFDALSAAMVQYVSDRVGPAFDTNVVAQSVAVIEELAYLGDALSYWQDGVATEAYLATARRRVSVTRHATTLDYRVDPGANARTWLRFAVTDGDPFVLPAGTAVLPAPGTDPDPAGDQTAPAVVFETMADLVLAPDRPSFPVLPAATQGPGSVAAGATSVVVLGDATEAVGALALLDAEPDVHDRALTPVGGQVVRVVSAERLHDAGVVTTRLAWENADALPSPAAAWMQDCRVRLGNIVLADHGQSLPPASLAAVVPPGTYRPRLPAANVTFAAPLGHAAAGGPAARALAPVGAPMPALVLEEWSALRPVRWELLPSLLDSGPYARAAVVEVENDGVGWLRFGDGVNGMRPSEGSTFRVRQRVGGGTTGNLSPGSLGRLATEHHRIARVEQAMAAVGGRDAQPLSAVRLMAPKDAYRNERAVTVGDFAALARTVPGVADVEVEMDWAGNWPVATAFVLTTAGWDGDPTVLGDVLALLDSRRVVGVEVAVRPATFVPLEVAIVVTAAAEFDRAAVADGVTSELERTLLAPGAFGFGTTLYRSAVVSSLWKVPGVDEVVVPVLRRMSRGRQVDTGDRVEPAVGEILRLANDAARPELGRVTFQVVRWGEAVGRDEVIR